MRWLALTLALLTASAALVAWVFLRDRDTSWRLPPQQAALVDARTVLTSSQARNAASDAPTGCSPIREPTTGWLVLIIDRSRPHCVDINVQTFAISPLHGLSGLQQIDRGSFAPRQDS